MWVVEGLIEGEGPTDREGAGLTVSKAWKGSGKPYTWVLNWGSGYAADVASVENMDELHSREGEAVWR